MGCSNSAFDSPIPTRSLTRLFSLSTVEVNASAVVSAIQAYAKINDARKWIERRETVNLSELFERMSTTELEEYARSGMLPEWFPVSPIPLATHGNGSTEENGG